METCPLDGGWPVGSAEDRRRLAALLCDDGGPPRPAGEQPPPATPLTIVDGLLACGAPDELAAAAAAGRPAWILLHMPLDDTGQDEAGLERRALRAAAGVICTSTSAAARIRARHGLDGVRVALPGTDTRRAGLRIGAAASPGRRRPAAEQGPVTAPCRAVSPDGPAVDRVPDRFRHRGPGLCRAAPGHGDAAGAAGPRPDPGGAAGRSARSGMGGGRPQPAHLAGRDLRARGHGIDCPGCARRGPCRHRRRRSARSRHPCDPTPRAAPTAPDADGGRARHGNPARAPPSPSARTRLPSRRCCGAGCPNPPSATRWRAAAVDARDRLPGWDATARTVLEALNPEHPAGTAVGRGGGKACRGRFPCRTSCWTMTP